MREHILKVMNKYGETTSAIKNMICMGFDDYNWATLKIGKVRSVLTKLEKQGLIYRVTDKRNPYKKQIMWALK